MKTRVHVIHVFRQKTITLHTNMQAVLHLLILFIALYNMATRFSYDMVVRMFTKIVS